jgi:hypothetical protein
VTKINRELKKLKHFFRNKIKFVEIKFGGKKMPKTALGLPCLNSRSIAMKRKLEKIKFC